MTEQTTIPDSPQPLDLSTALEKVTQEIAVFDRLNAGIAQLEAEHPSNLVIDVTTPAGMKEAIKARAAWRDPRVSVEKARKVAKAPILALGRQLDTFAESIEKRLRVGEDNYNAQIKVETERQEAIKAEAKAREEARVQAIRDRIAMKFTSRPGAMFGASAADLDAAIRAVVAESVTAEVFFELLPDAQAAQDRALVTLRDMHDKQSDRERAEAEQKRIAEENARQAAKLADERAEFEKLQAQAKREQEERERQERIARETREAAEREAREAREAEIRKREDAIRAEQKRLDDARRAEEDAKAAAERKRLDDEAAAQRAAAAAKAEEERKAAEAARIAEEERIAKEEAKRAKAARKLAAAQKAGPRLLEAIKPLIEIAMHAPGGHQEAIDEARAAVAEGEAA
jgi:DNA repair exonuclease SbcCD ATPase subunit